jgi:hypothetical protein
MTVAIQPYLCLAFVHEQTGATFEERYYSDLEYRHEQDALINRRLHEYFQDHWPEVAGNWAHEPGYSVGVPAAYIIVATLFGAKIKYYANFHPDCTPNPLAWVTEPDQLRVPDVWSSWPLDRYWDQYRQMAARHGRERVSFVGFGSAAVHWPQLQGIAMHSPLTTAYKLRGTQLFLDMEERPELAQRLFDVIRDTYYQICDRLIEEADHKSDVIFFGACFSSLVSERVWRAWEMPAITEIAERYGARILLHSCGRSTHVLKPISELPGLLEAHLGDETDLAEARRLMPDVGFYVVPDSVAWAVDPPEATRRSVHAMMDAAASGPLAFQFVMEQGISPDVISEVVSEVRDYNAAHAGKTGRLS